MAREEKVTPRQQSTTTRRTGACAFFAFLSACAVSATDWPQFRGVSRSGTTTEPSGWNGTAWPIRKLWQTRVGDGCTSPLLVGGRVYTMGWQFTTRSADRKNPYGRDTVVCLDAEAGEVVWTHAYEQMRYCRHHTYDEANYGGPNATPTFDRELGQLYTHGIDGDFRCLAIGDGSLKWQMNIYDRYRIPQNPEVYPNTHNNDYGCISSPLVFGNWVLLEVGSPDNGLIMAFDRRTGAEAWASELKTWAGQTPGPQLITVDGIQCLATLTLEHLVIVRLDRGNEGRTMATFPWKAGWDENLALPAVDGDLVLLTGYHWINGGRNDGASAVLRVSPTGIRQLWKSLPCSKATGGTLYRGYAYIGSDNLHCVDALTGEERWVDPDRTGDDFGCGASVVLTGDNKLLYLSERNTLYLAEPGHAAKEYTRLAKVTNVLAPSKGHTWPHVVLADRKILVKDKSGNLACYGVGVSGVPGTDNTASRVPEERPDTPPLPPAENGRGPLRHWTFDEGVESIPGIAGASPTPGRHGAGLRFDGSDDYVDAGFLDVSGSALTLAAWVRMEQGERPDPRVISKASGWGEQDHFWMLGFTGSAARPMLRFRLRTHGRTLTLNASRAPVELGRWSHVAAVYDGREMRLCLDGQTVATSGQSGPIDTDDRVPVWIGGNPPGASDRPFKGTIDEVRVYARALTAQELRDLAQAKSPAALPGGQRADWPRFRGPDGAGIATGDAPLGWDEDRGINMGWKSPVPLPGASSPVACEGRIFLTGADAKKREVYCFRVADGALLWRRPVAPSGDGVPQKEHYQGMTYAGPTPVTDGNRVFAAFGNGDLACFEFDGRAVWTRNVGCPETGYGYSSSLETHGDLLFVDVPQGSDADPAGRLMALDQATGRTVWEASGKQHPAADSWATPVVMRSPQGALLVTRGGGWVIGREPLTGRTLWQVESETGDVCTSPIWADGLIVSAGYGGKTDAIRPDGTVAWSCDEAYPDVPSPLVVNGVLLLLDSQGLLIGLRVRDGRKLFELDLAEIHNDLYYASPVAAGDKVYILSSDGVALVLQTPRADQETPPAVHAVGRLAGQQHCWATPAIADGRLFLRTKTHLYCVSGADIVRFAHDAEPP